MKKENLNSLKISLYDTVLLYNGIMITKKTDDKYDLGRFINTQSLYYQQALSEIKAGKKRSHWMWFIFPQLKELGYSDNAKYYGISGLEEAKAYIANEILRNRLIEISTALVNLESSSAEEIFGWPDDKKLRTSMTLFEAASPDLNIFSEVLSKFFHGERDERTLELIKN